MRSLWIKIFALFFIVSGLLALGAAGAAPMDKQSLTQWVMPPFSVGEPLNDKGVYELLNSGGSLAGYIFETEPLAPLPGFSGAPINVLVTLDLEGKFLDVRLIEHNEPIFVSGLGEAPFHQFFEQYPGLSISSTIVVGTPYGAGNSSSLVYLDGVTKATASVRIAHESVMAAAVAVAKEKMQGLARLSSAYPNPDYDEVFSWSDLVEQKIATRMIVTNAEIDKAFADTLWEDDDPEAKDNPDEPYLDLWVVDLGPKSIARAALSKEGYVELQDFLKISSHDEPILVIETARHGLVSEDFVRNTAPDRLSAEQDGLPVALRDSDLLVDLAEGAPDGVAMILRTDRRLGFDPAREWTLKVAAVREHGMFRPETGAVDLPVRHVTDERFFLRPGIVETAPPWLEAIYNRATDLALLAAFLLPLVFLLHRYLNHFASLPSFGTFRIAILLTVIVFVGWWGQGQLSIVTPLAIVRAIWEGGSIAFLLYDPFSLAIWSITIIGFVLWGRGLFCGWLCPFGAMQELSYRLGRLLKLPEYRFSDAWDARLKWVKYALLASMVAVVFLAPSEVDAVAEVEPFKTAITTYFDREWYFVLYAALWLVSGMVLFKGFCRYVCPLGAVMAIGGLLRRQDWVARRVECGSPCQLCKVKCDYGAIAKDGAVNYSECFQCLDCVTIHQDPQLCVPLVLAVRRETKIKDVAS